MPGPVWLKELDILRTKGPGRARESRRLYYKPAALLVALDLVESDPRTRITFSEFAPRFASLLDGFEGQNAKMPFFHWSQVNNRIWTLEPAPSESEGVREETEAVFRVDLLPGLLDRDRRGRIRHRVLGILAVDDHPQSTRLLLAYARAAWT